MSQGMISFTYKTASGNYAVVDLLAEEGKATIVHANWERESSDADRQECHSFISELLHRPIDATIRVRGDGSEEVTIKNPRLMPMPTRSVQ